RLLAKSPLDRFSDASQVVEALGQAIGENLHLETALTRESFLQAAQLAGREAELSQLTQVLRQAIQGQGSAWLIGGESGVGKSRLLDELRTLGMVEGAAVLVGQAVSEGGRLYGLWRAALRWLTLASELSDTEASILKLLVPDVGTLLGRDVADAPEVSPEAARERLLTTIVNLFDRQTQPILLILEDIHWVSGSLEVLKRLIPITSRKPLVILASYGDAERPYFPGTLDQMQLLKVNRLTAGGIAAVAEAMLGSVGRRAQVVQLLERETEGNAFFLVEVVRALAEETGQLDAISETTLPEHVVAGGMQRLVERRLGRAPAEAMPLLQAAAIMGRYLDRQVLHQIDPAVDLERWLTQCAD